MSLENRVYSVLLVSSAEKFNTATKAMLPESGYNPVAVVTDIATAKRAVARRDFDFIIINSPLTDDVGIHFAIDCSTSRNANVLLLVKNEIHAEVYDRVSEYGIFTLPKPISKQAMDTALRWMKTAQNKLKKAETKTTKVEEKMKEIRNVNKAKWLLIDLEKMNEPDAHRYLEKQAMDRCISKNTVALEIIEKYS